MIQIVYYNNNMQDVSQMYTLSLYDYLIYIENYNKRTKKLENLYKAY